jgi:integrase
MRRGEILTLKWFDVDLNINFIVINKTNTKSKKSREDYINSVLKRFFLKLRLKSSGNEDVFLDDKGNRLKEIKNGYNSACSRAGIEGLRFHDLRHSAATRMIESGVNIVAVSKISGHSDIKTTMRYTHPDISLKGALENLVIYEQSTTNITTSENIEKDVAR